MEGGKNHNFLQDDRLHRVPSLLQGELYPCRSEGAGSIPSQKFPLGKAIFVPFLHRSIKRSYILTNFNVIPAGEPAHRGPRSPG